MKPDYEALARADGWYEYESEWRKDLENGYLYAATAEHAVKGTTSEEAER